MRLPNPLDILREISLVLVATLARSRLGIGSYLTVEAMGRERLPDRPFVLCSNHTSHLDYIALVEALGIPHREVIAVAASDYHFDRSIRGYIFRRMFNMAPIERGGSLVALRNCAAICQRFIDDGGKVVLVFPEGTRSPDGQMKPFKHGFVPIVASLGLPVVPAYIQGGFEVFSRHSIFPRHGKVSVRFGEPVGFPEEGPGRRLSTAEAKQFAARLEQSVRQLSKKARR